MTSNVLPTNGASNWLYCIYDILGDLLEILKISYYNIKSLLQRQILSNPVHKDHSI